MSNRNYFEDRPVITVAVKLPIRVASEVKRLAKADDRTISAYLRRKIEAAVEAEQTEEEA